jgi:hypothetical protein
VNRSCIDHVSTRRPSRSLGAQSRQPVGFGRNVVGLQVKVHTVLDGFALGHLVKHQDGSELTVGVDGDGREVLGGAVVDAAVQGLGPELRELGGVVRVEADCQYRDAHDVVFDLSWC